MGGKRRITLNQKSKHLYIWLLQKIKSIIYISTKKKCPLRLIVMGKFYICINEYNIYMLDIVKELLNKEAEAISNIPLQESIPEAVNKIYETVHQNGGKLISSGMGKAGQIALNIATTFSSTGTPSLFIHPSDAQHGDLGVITKNDILLLISNSGKTREIIELLALTHNLVGSIPVIVITGNPEAELSQTANIIISTGHPNEICPLGLTPTTSTTTMTVIGDILVVLLMKKIKFNQEDYAKRHHGGYLGKKSREIRKN